MTDVVRSAAAPPARATVLRVLVAAYVAVWTAVRAPQVLEPLDFVAERLDPVGPLFFLDGPLPDALLVVLVVVTPFAALAMAAGVLPRVSGPATAIGFLVLTTYRNSWGNIFHTENLVVLHLAVLAIVPYRRGRDTTWAVDAMAVLTVGTYFVAGVAKLRISGFAWLDGDVLRHQIAFDNARKQVLGDVSSPFAGWILRQSWLLAPAALMTMVVELGAPLALMHHRLRNAWVGAAIAFHIGIVAFMAIVFPYQLVGIALAPLLPVERLGATVLRWTERFRPASPTSAPIG